MNNFDNNIMDWDSTIESDGQQYITLDEGDYSFTVTAFERSRFPGSAKIPPCPKASLTFAVDLPDGRTATCKEDLILYRTLEWKLASFFRSIGQKKSGERLVMDWSKVIGAKGRAHFKPRTYIANGEERTANSVDHYIDSVPEDNWVQECEQAVINGTVQQMQAPRAEQQRLNWQNGGF